MSISQRSARSVLPCGNCLVTVAPDEIATWEYCGSYKGILKAGLSCLGVDCCGGCVSTRVTTTRISEHRVTCETKTKDNVFVRIDVAVQMQILPENTYDAIYRLTDPAAQVESFVKDVVRGHVPGLDLDHTFASKDELASAVLGRLSESMATFGYKILNALVTDIDPDRSVKNAMNEIETSKRMRQAQETNAMAAKNVAIKAAEGEAESKFLQGQGIARQRGAIIDGLRDSLADGDNSQVSSQRVSELLLITQYFDTIKEVANGKACTIFTPGSSSGGSSAALLPNQQRM